MDSLHAATDVLSHVEQATSQADELLTQSRTEWLRTDEWRTLSCLVRWNKHSLPLYRPRLNAELERIVEGGALSSADATLVKESLQRLADTHSYLTSDNPPWANVCRRIETLLPIGPGKRAALDSRIASGPALRGHLAGAYPSDDSAVPRETRYNHVARLTRTDLANDKGQSIFSAIRHRVIGAPELCGELLGRLADDELKALVGVLHIREESTGDTAGAREPRIADCCLRIRNDPEFAGRCAETMRIQACRNMARELAAAALVADRAQWQWALSGQTAELNLFSVSLLTPGNIETWAGQQNALAELNQGDPVELHVPGLHGTPLKALVKIKVRQFVLSADQEKLDVTSHYRAPGAIAARLDAIRQLLGDENSPELGGEVMANIGVINATRRELAELEDDYNEDHMRSALDLGADHPETLEICRIHSQVKEELDLFARRARTLEEAGKQLKALWLVEGDWPAGGDAHRHAAARLALVAHLMGETPLLSCMSDKDLTEQLDSEVKFLAAVADNQDGQLPPADLDRVVWASARRDFRCQ